MIDLGKWANEEYRVAPAVDPMDFAVEQSDPGLTQ